MDEYFALLEEHFAQDVHRETMEIEDKAAQRLRAGAAVGGSRLSEPVSGASKGASKGKSAEGSADLPSALGTSAAAEGVQMGGSDAESSSEPPRKRRA